MRRVNNRDEGYKKAIKVAKRIGITILCCIPIMIIFGYLTRKVISSDVVQVICFMIIMGIAVAVEEVIVRAKEKQKEQEIETKKDVFK